MPSHELIRVFTPLPSLVLTTLIDTALPLSALLDQLVQENDQQLKREVSGEILEGDEEAGEKKWALVRVRRRAVGNWTEGERLDDEEEVDSTTTIASTLTAPPPPTVGVSTFAASAHLHSPSLRLVFLPRTISLSLAQIPSFPPEVTLTIHTSILNTAGEVIESVVESCGVRKVIAGGGGRLEFVLTPDVHGQIGPPLAHSARLPPTTTQFTLTLSDKSLAKLGKPPTTTARTKIPSSTTTNPQPAGWRPATIFGSLWAAPTAPTPSSPTDPSPTTQTPSTEPAAEEVAEEDEEEPSEPTLKLRTAPSTLSNPASRLSSLFSPWSASPTSPTEDSATPRRARLVSAPVLAEEGPDAALRRFSSWTPGMGGYSGGGAEDPEGEEADAEEEDLEKELEGLMDDLGLKPPQRLALSALPPDRQRFLIAQHRSPPILRPSKTGPASASSPSHPTSTDPPPPQLPITKRFSLWADPSPAPSPATTPGMLTPSTTGRSGGGEESWSSWWTLASNATGTATTATTTNTSDDTAKDTPRFYVDQLRSTKISQRSLVKHLIALRVRLSTAKLAWTAEFLSGTEGQDANGLDALGGLLGQMAHKLVLRKPASDADETVQGECVKCLRVLLNTDIGFSAVLSTSPLLLPSLAQTLLSPSPKLRALVSDVLAAICVLSLSSGHAQVLSAMGELGKALRYVDPPESLLVQLELYAEERQDDLDEVRERSSRSTSDPVIGDLERLGGDHPALYPLLLDLSSKLVAIYEKPSLDAVFRSDLLNVVENFVVQSSALEKWDEWGLFWRNFLDSIALIVGEPQPEISHPHQRSTTTTTDQGDKESTSSVFERLLVKEQEVIALQAEVVRLRVPVDDVEGKKERVDRNRYYETLLDETKLHALELETSLESSQKEIKYLHRALESVYSRFRPVVPPPSPDVLVPSIAPEESIVDPEDMAERSIEALVQRDLEIAQLKEDLARGIPAPPPPPGFTPPPLQRRTTIRASQKKMKPFFWTKLSPNNLASSVWSDLDSTLEPLDLADLERDFAIGGTGSGARSAGPTPSKVAAGGKKQPTTVLGLARAQNIAIMLARLKMPHVDVRDAVLFIDDTKLTLDNLKAIKHFAPSTEEMEAIRSYPGDITSLAASDQYLNEMMVIPRLGERLSSMLYRRRLEMEQEELKPEVNILRSAADELKNSVKFKKLLSTVLSLGNMLNASTFRGDADGFQLEALLKLKEARATSPSASTPTLLHYLARVLLRSDPSLLAFLDDAPHVEAASRISFSTVLASANGLVVGVAQVQEEVRVLRRMRNSPEGDRFIPKMETFIQRAEPAMAALKSMMTNLDRDLKALVSYYGENPIAMKPEDLFGIVASFSSSLLRAASEIQETDGRLRTPKSTPSPSSGRRGAPNATPSPSARRSLHPKDASGEGHRSLGRGGFDDAMRDLRNGVGSRRQRSSMGGGGDGGGTRLSRVFLDGSAR
ncbi:hypothetical protein RQP46_005599 [Phenoliferia psychrophenolica]